MEDVDSCDEHTAAFKLIKYDTAIHYISFINYECHYLVFDDDVSYHTKLYIHFPNMLACVVFIL